MKEKKTYYEIQLDALKCIKRVEDRRSYVEKIDFSKPIESERDAKIIKEINVYKDFIDEGIIKDGKTKSQELVDNAKRKEEDLQGTSHFIWDEDQVLKKKVFPMDIHKNIFYIGLLLPKTKDNEVRGKVYGKIQVQTPVMITDSKELLEINERTKEDLHIGFNNVPDYLPHRWRLDFIKRFIDGKTEKIDGELLLSKIKDTYENYLAIRNKTWYKIYSLWDIGTYMYQIFEAYPLIENRGIAGTGKTKSMSISSLISFNGGQIMVNPSESTLFRETEEIKGTKYFDEAEKLWVYNKSTKKYEGDVRTELINASYTKEAKVPRQEKILNRFVTKWYSPFSPTQLSSINGLYGATESRAITRICTKSSNEDPRGEKEPSEDRKNPIWEEIRDECYRFALENWKEIKKIYNNFPKDCGLKRRDLQIWKPLLSIAKFISEEEYKEILSFAIEISKMRLDDLIHESSFDYMCLAALKEVIEKNPETDKIYVELIKYAFCNAKGDEEGKKDIYLNRNISTRLDHLGFKELRKKDRKGSYYSINSQIFSEIVTPSCPNLSFLSSTLSHSSQLSINEGKKCDDGMTISDDKENKSVMKVTIDDENDDDNEVEVVKVGGSK